VSESVTHVAVCDDVVRLASRHPAIPAAFNESLARHLDIARQGAATRSAGRWSAALIAWARDNWPAPGCGRAKLGTTRWRVPTAGRGETYARAAAGRPSLDVMRQRLRGRT
jgi:hypothetical protein